MGFQITGDPAADQVLDESPFALLVGHDARPAVPDGARLPRAGEGAGPVRHVRARPRSRRPTPRSSRRWRDAAGHPPVPGLDGGPAAGAGRGSSRTSTTVTPRGCGPRRPTARTCSGGCRRCPGFGKQKAQIFVALLAKQLGVRPEGWEAAVGRLRRSRATARSPTWSTRRRCRRCATSRRRRRRAGQGERPWLAPISVDTAAALGCGPSGCRGRMTTRLLTSPGLAAPRCALDERCSCLRTHASCSLQRC